MKKFDFSRSYHDIMRSCRRNKPEIQLAIGIVCGVGALITTYFAARKVDEIIERSEQRVNEIHQRVADATVPEYTEETSKHDLTRAAVRTTLEWVWNFAPAITLEAVSVGLILASHAEMRNRNMLLGAALTSTIANFRNYRNNVVAEYGSDVDEKMLYGAKETTKTETIVNEDGTTQVIDSNVVTASYIPDDYCAVFGPWADVDRTIKNGYYYPNNEMANMHHIEFQQDVVKRIADKYGVATLAQAEQLLGIKPTPAAHILGWERGDKVEFKTRPMNDVETGCTIIAIEFNVRGDVITSKLTKPKMVKRETTVCETN